jgi:hypothetical protein
LPEFERACRKARTSERRGTGDVHPDHERLSRFFTEIRFRRAHVPRSPAEAEYFPFGHAPSGAERFQA